MKFKKNAEIIDSEGEKIGHLDRIVVDPSTKQLTHLVIKKGLLFTRDKVVPVESALNATEKQITLNINKKQKDEFPDFEKKHHIPLGNNDNKGYSQSVLWYYPDPRVAWWNIHPDMAYTESPYFVRVKRHIPPEKVVINKETKVFSADGYHMGEVNQVFTEPDKNLISHVLINPGRFHKNQKLIPTLWINSILENEIHLSVDQNIIEKVPFYKPDD